MKMTPLVNKHYLNGGTLNRDNRPKSAAAHLTRYCTIQNLWELLNEILCSFVAQGTANYNKLKFEVRKIILFKSLLSLLILCSATFIRSRGKAGMTGVRSNFQRGSVPRSEV